MRRTQAATWLKIGLLLVACTASATAWAQSGGEPFSRMNALESRLFADAADGCLDEHSLPAAALVAGGVNDADALRRYQQQLDVLVDELRRSGELRRSVAGPPRRQARAVFEFMHRRILHGGYRIDCTDLTATLDEGRFNCVSATVLLCCLADRLGLEAHALVTPGHVMCRLVLDDGTLDVESTCPDWFRRIDNPGSACRRRLPSPTEAPSAVNRRRESPPTVSDRAPCFDADSERAERSPASWRELSGVELVATIYYNRGVDLLAAGQFARAVDANAKAMQLDPASQTARGNLLAVLNNWAIARGGAGDYAEAVGLLRTGLALEPDFETFQANYVHVHNQWVEHLCNAHRYEDALDVLAQAAREQPQETWFHQARLEVYRCWAGPAYEHGVYGHGVYEHGEAAPLFPVSLEQPAER